MTVSIQSKTFGYNSEAKCKINVTRYRKRLAKILLNIADKQ